MKQDREVRCLDCGETVVRRQIAAHYSQEHPNAKYNPQFTETGRNL